MLYSWLAVNECGPWNIECCKRAQNPQRTQLKLGEASFEVCARQEAGSVSTSVHGWAVTNEFYACEARLIWPHSVPFRAWDAASWPWLFFRSLWPNVVCGVERKVTAWKRSKLATASMVGRGMMQYKPRIVWNVLDETNAAVSGKANSCIVLSGIRFPPSTRLTRSIVIKCNIEIVLAGFFWSFSLF